MFDEFKSVILTHDIDQYSLKKDERGVVVFVYGNGAAYEVEFMDPSGRTIAVLTLTPKDIRPVGSPILDWTWNEPLWSELKSNINTESSSENAKTKAFSYQYI